MKPGWKYFNKKVPVVGKLFLLFLVLAFCSFLSPLTVLAGEFSKPEHIILTWSGDPETSQTITWLMPDNSNSQVQYLRAEEYNGGFDTAQQISVAGTAFNSTYYRYTVNITGLIPDTKYVYRVGREGVWSDASSFTTAAHTDNFSFLYMGDVQEGYNDWGNMLNSVYQANPQIKFALLGGDLTNNGSDETEWGQFLNVATGTFSRIPVMPAMGNHDGIMYVNFFALPDNGPEGLKQSFYSFDYGNAHFVVLNSTNNTNEKVKQWLQEDLQNTTKSWKFVIFHHPAYPAFNDGKMSICESIQENWVPILEQNGVDVVFVGHQHEYMRTYPIYQGEVQIDPAADGIVYVMGNAGSKTYGGGGGFPYIAREETGSNYQVIEIKGNVLTITSKKSSDEVIETYTITKEITFDPEPNPIYTVTPGTDTAYTSGQTGDGINIMTVNPGITGLKYFLVDIHPVISHYGDEVVVFTHSRNGNQLGLNATKADFDVVSTVQAGFNVLPGDVIKTFIVDNLTNSIDFNPILFQ